MLKSVFRFAVAATLCTALLSACCQESVIKVKTPARPAGQEDVIGLTAPAIETVHVAIIGVGDRGTGAVYRYIKVPWSQISAIADVEQDRVDKAVKMVTDAGLPAPDGYAGLEGYKQICERDDIDLVYICTDWTAHTPIALYAMEHGKHVAIEVPAATSLDECWALVNTSERTRKHCMMLENCCYDFFELSALQMAREGALGEILHAEGAYCHNLADYWTGYWNNWRLTFNRTHEGDVYPTHGLGPCCQALNIHRGDRFTTLVAMDTKSVNGPAQVKKQLGEDDPDFANGDLTCTLIRTEKGKTILIEHDVLTPRPYNRMYQLVGTKGFAAKYPIDQFGMPQAQLDALGIDVKLEDEHEALPAEVVEMLRAKFPNPILNEELEETAKKVGGHGGMDFIMDYRLIYCLHYGLPLDMDVYDLAEWCCLGELGSISIANGNAAVEVPDFTRGAWQKTDGFRYAFSDGSFK